MKRGTLLISGAVAATLTIGAFAIPAIAGGGPGHWGPGMGFGRMGGGCGPGMMMSRGAPGPMGMRSMMDNPVFRAFDADRDGTVTPTEAKAGVAALQKKFDADGDGRLSKPEFAALFAEMTRGFADRPFAMLDADGDGSISAEEMAFPAQMMVRMQMRFAPPPSEGETRK